MKNCYQIPNTHNPPQKKNREETSLGIPILKTTTVLNIALTTFYLLQIGRKPPPPPYPRRRGMGWQIDIASQSNPH